MASSITTNVTAMRTTHALARTNDASIISLERLSSGRRINRAADDASGLSISVGLRTQVGGLTVAVRNNQDGVSVVRTADGALGETTAILPRLRDLAVQAASDGSLTSFSRSAIQSEVGQLKDQLSHIAATTTWNGVRLLDGTYSRLFQVGANVDETVPVVISVPGKGVGAEGLGLTGMDVTGPSVTLPSTVTPAVSAAQGVPTAGRVELSGDFVTAPAHAAAFEGLAGTITYDGKAFDLGTVDYTGAVTATDYLGRLNAAAIDVFGTSHTPFTGSATGLTMTGATPGAGTTAADAQRLTPAYAGSLGADLAIAAIDDAVDAVSSLRSYLGATQNRFEHTIAQLQVAIENTSSSASRISDSDMAAEMSAFAGHQVRSESGMAMLAQATQTPRTILSLLN
jgi:flagellin-like hook-associated protein FlgL